MSDWGSAAVSARDTPTQQRPMFSMPKQTLKARPRDRLMIVEKIATNLTLEEQYRIYGRIEGPQCEELLDLHDWRESLDGTDKAAREASGCFPAEDVLTETIQDLTALLASVRGANRDALGRIVHQLEGISSKLQSSAEYGRDELRKVIKALGGTP